MTYEEILHRLEGYRSALAAEDRLVRTGLKTRPALSSVRDEHAEVFSEASLITVREVIERAPQARKREQSERALFALLEGMMAEDTLPLEERILAEAGSLEAKVGDETVAFYDFAGRIGREEDFEKRDELRKAQAGLVAKLAPLRLEMELMQRKRLAAFGFRSAREYAETKRRMRYDVFLPKILPILQETSGLYRRVMSDAVRRSYGKELGTLSSAHAIHWRAGREFTHLFPPDKLPALCAGAFATLGLPYDQDPRIRIDTEARPGKHPRACSYAASAPEEIHLIFKPQGGYEDVRAFLHESTHAVHLANTDADLPYEWRALPRSFALGEAYAFLIEHLSENPLWLEHVMRVPKGAAERLGAWALLGNLFMLRRYVGKFTYELAFDERPSDTVRNQELYSKTLKDLTGFVYEPEFWLEDMDPDFYSADYIRAWIASTQLEEHLVRLFGDRWFLKRDSGAYLKGLFSRGTSWTAEEMIQSVGMTSWDPLPLIRRFDGVSRLLR